MSESEKARAFYEFQSAPLTDVRGDADNAVSISSLIVFQSAPLTDVRGDERDHGLRPKASTFQSAPLTDVRGDASAKLLTALMISFNPLPSRM